MELQLGQRYELTVLSEPQFSIKGFLANLFKEWYINVDYHNLYHLHTYVYHCIAHSTSSCFHLV